MGYRFKNIQVVRSILLLLKRGYAERKIAAEVNVSRTTIRNYRERFYNSGYSFDELFALENAALSELIYPPSVPVFNEHNTDPRRHAFESMQDYFLKELKRTGVTKQLLWEEYLRQHPDGFRYTQFCERLRRYENTRHVSMRFNYKPGELMMIDFAGDKLHYINKETGELIGCQVLVCVLPCSGYSFVVALPDATIPQLIKGLNACLAFFGGAPYTLKCDNMRQAVTKSCRYEPVFSEAISAWALHNGIHLTAARVGRPRDKPHVENEVKVIYNRIYAPLRNRELYTIEELNKAVIELLKEHHEKQFSKNESSRKQIFDQEELEELQPLPPEVYVLKYETKSKVQRNYHVFLGQDRHFYSVPFHLVGTTLRIVYDTDLVEIYHHYQRIAVHKRNFRRHDYTTLPEHRPEAHQRYQEQMSWDSEYFLKEAMDNFGIYTFSYIKRMLESKQYPEQMYNSCIGLLRLSKTYPHARVEAACRRALKGSSADYSTIKTILAENADGLTESGTDGHKEMFK
jgi:transposase